MENERAPEAEGPAKTPSRPFSPLAQITATIVPVVLILVFVVLRVLAFMEREALSADHPLEVWSWITGGGAVIAAAVRLAMRVVPAACRVALATFFEARRRRFLNVILNSRCSSTWGWGPSGCAACSSPCSWALG
jgi:hypothetical protein